MRTPHIYDIDSTMTSGHYDNYRENMFFVTSHDETASR